MQSRIANGLLIAVLVSLPFIGIAFYIWIGDRIGLWLLTFLILIFIFVLMVHLYIWKMYHYDCPKCSTSFQPSFTGSLTAINMVEERGVKCPNCGFYGLMKALKNSEKHR